MDNTLRAILADLYRLDLENVQLKQRIAELEAGQAQPRQNGSVSEKDAVAVKH